MLSLLLTLAAAPSVASAQPALPAECETPALRDVAPLKELVKLENAFSLGLDSVATWCFDSGGNWTGGAVAKKGKPQPSPDAAPAGECSKALAGCEKAAETLNNKSPLRELASAARSDLDRPYLKGRYVPKRSGVSERPANDADCSGKSRSGLFAAAQQRMDWARLIGQIQNEYGNYKTWLMTEGLKCRNAVLAARKDPTQKGLTIDNASDNPAAVATVEPTTPPRPMSDRDRALAGDMLEKWRYFAKLQATFEADRDYLLGFLASRELKACNCPKVSAAVLVRSLEKQEGGEIGMTLLREDDPGNTKCALCGIDAFPVWKDRATRQCLQMDSMTEAELFRLERSDDSAGVPARCFDDARSRRLTARAALQQSVPMPTPPAPSPSPSPAKTAAPTNLQNVNGYTYYRPSAAPTPSSAPVVPAPSPYVVAINQTPNAVPPPSVAPSSPSHDAFVPPQAYAPIPAREEGRIYVRLFMSSGCVAEIMPGPIQVRTGDLMLVPIAAKSLQVKSGCGGLAEVYFGQEVKPRFSEIFARSQPIRFEFKPQ